VTTLARIATYGNLDRLPGSTGSDVQRQMASLKTRLIARYKLHTTPGRPEELTGNLLGIDSALNKTVSLGYGCKTIRIRKHGGPTNRTWDDTIDIQLNAGWHDEVYSFLDSFFGYVSPRVLA
jgi:hypothetical protein